MAKFQTDFSEFPTGAKPTGWITYTTEDARNSAYPDSRWNVAADAGATGGQVLQCLANAGVTLFILWPDVPASEHQRAQLRWRASGQNNSDLRPFCRAADAMAADGYTLGVRRADLDINKLSAGSLTNLANDAGGYSANDGEWYRTEVEVTGVNPTTLRVKSWPESGTKPSTWSELGGGPEGAVSDTDSTDIESGGFGLLNFQPDPSEVDWLVVTTAGEAPEFGGSTPTLRKSSTFDIETTLSGTVTNATLDGNAITVDSQAGTTVTLTDSDGSITTSGEYDLVLTDDSADPDETIVVQVNVVGVAPSSNPLQKDGAALASLTDVQIRIANGANLNGVQRYYTATGTTDASGNLGNIDLSDTAANVDDSVLLQILTAAGDSITAPETVGLI